MNPLLVRIAGAALLSPAILPLSHGADAPAPTQVLMKQKLKDAQELLAAVSTGDFPAMEKAADHLVQLSNHTNWYSRQTPEYDLFLNGFRQNASALSRAAQAKNADAASLAYIRLTMDCFSCHKYMRVPSNARLESPELRELVGAAK
jgi:cytochrome c556